MNVPEKHREIAHAWVDGEKVQFLTHSGWEDAINNPMWIEGTEYRVKPHLVKKWKWIIQDKVDANYIVSIDYFSDEDVKTSNNAYIKFVQKIDHAMIEVEE